MGRDYIMDLIRTGIQRELNDGTGRDIVGMAALWRYLNNGGYFSAVREGESLNLTVLYDGAKHSFIGTVFGVAGVTGRHLIKAEAVPV